MNAPWKGEKVSGFIRALAWVFIACALIAIGGMSYFGFLKGEGLLIKGGIAEYLQFAFGFTSTCYIFLLFTKVALTGFAPRSWIPWR
jgi:hypothetical protein